MEFYVAGTKLVALSEAASLVRAAQDHRQTVVLCHGCFDIVHPGHIRHLQHAAKLGDRLLVTITGDTVVDKGTGRPLIPQELRAENLAALDCVDWVAVNPEATAVQLLELVRPDVYVKGREYEHNRDPRFLAEKDVVERYGGQLVFTSGDVVFSSTALIAAMEQTLDPINHRVRRLIGDEGLDRGSIDRLLESFRGRRVTVVGETIIDTYVICDRPDVAGEGPIMTLRPVEYRSFDGGAAIIAGHLAAMGAQPTLVTALPQTPKSQELTRRLAGQGVDVRSVAHAGPIMEKQRFLVGSSKVMKLDLGQPLTLDATRGKELIQTARDAAAESDAVILADFGEGLFTSVLMGQLCLALRPLVDLLVGDVSGRRSNLLSMRQVDMLCPSEPEVREALHDYDDGLSAVVWKLLHKTAGRSAIVTLGGEGSIAFECPADIELSADDWQTRLAVRHVPALVPYAVDQLGCGDALLAAATLTRLAGGSLTRAAIVGAVAAAVESQQLGNAVIGTADLRRGLYRLCQSRPAYTAKDAVTAVSQTGDQLHLAHA
ncbi:MAG: adenylyltransferase/cytidyltransferase family protein [Planctomycetes bacterium]|nr:adenylyltransferase/cytidyltransferase family protein [Planctomycetota bacterium]